MKKGVVLLLILITGLYFYNKIEGQLIQDEEQEQTSKDSLLSPQVAHNVTSHQEKILRNVLKKEITKTQDFKDIVNKDKKSPVTNALFLKETLETLIDCYKEGCGEEPDHDGYYNEAQTVAAITINRILRDSLESETTPEWLQENDLLELFSSKNENTRDLVFKHLMRKGDPQTQINKILDQTPQLDGDNVGDVFKNIVKNMNSDNEDIIVDAMIRILEDPNKDDLAKDSTREALIKSKVSELSVLKYADSSCSGLKDVNNRNSTIYQVKTLAETNNMTLDLTQHCNK